MAHFQCLKAEELADALKAPPSDPRHQHLAECPRCKSLALEYQVFLAGEGGPGALNREEADQLDKALAGEMDGSSLVPGLVSPARAADGPRARFSGWWLAVPSLAAVLVLVFFFPFRNTQDAGLDLMRGNSPSSPELVVRVVDNASGDGLLLNWAEAAPADSFVVQLLASDLTLLATIPTGRAMMLELSPDKVHLPDGCRFYRVLGYLEGSPVVRSGLGDLSP